MVKILIDEIIKGFEKTKPGLLSQESSTQKQINNNQSHDTKKLFIELSKHNIPKYFDGKKGKFWIEIDGNKKNVNYPLIDGKIPTKPFKIHNPKNNNSSLFLTQIQLIPYLPAQVNKPNAFSELIANYICLCGDEVKFKIERTGLKNTSYMHAKCGYKADLMLHYERSYIRNTNIKDHVIVKLNEQYAIIGKIEDSSLVYSGGNKFGGVKIKLPIKKREEFEKLEKYLQKDRIISVIQYQEDTSRTDFPYPYNYNSEDFGFNVLKVKAENAFKSTSSTKVKTFRAQIVSYALNTTAELRLKQV